MLGIKSFNAHPAFTGNSNKQASNKTALKQLSIDVISFKALPDKTFLDFIAKTAKGCKKSPHVIDTLAYAIDSKNDVKVKALEQRLKDGYEPIYKLVLEDLAKAWGVEIPKKS